MFKMDLGEFRCHHCSMVFRSVGLLDKHKVRFCVGSSGGDLTALQRAQEVTVPERSCGGLLYRKTKTLDLICLREQRKKLMKQGDRLKAHEKANMTDSLAFSKLTEEFQKLRMSVEESLLRNHTEKSPVIQDLSWVGGEMFQEVKLHEQKIAEIRAHTAQLERQREEIEQKLAGSVGHDGTTNPELKLLKLLKDQDEKNETVLHHLAIPINDLQGEKDVEFSSDHIEDKKNPETFYLMSSLDGPLSSQIRSLQQAYIQCGGSDQEVLAHLCDLQAEAHSLEQTRSRAKHRAQKSLKYGHLILDSDIFALEHENQWLEKEILTMQIARERCGGENELYSMQRNYIHQIYDLQAEICSLRREVENNMLKSHHPNHQDHGSQQTSFMGRYVLDPLDTHCPAPYDPVSKIKPI